MVMVISRVYLSYIIDDLLEFFDSLLGSARSGSERANLGLEW